MTITRLETLAKASAHGISTSVSFISGWVDCIDHHSLDGVSLLFLVGGKDGKEADCPERGTQEAVAGFLASCTSWTEQRSQVLAEVRWQAVLTGLPNP